MSIQNLHVDYYQHWHYFLELEKEFANTLRFVEYVPDHLDVYSFEFARLLLLSCSELDVIFKIVCTHINPSSAADSIGDYFSEITTVFDITVEKVIIPRFKETLLPFEKWDKGQPPFWWTNYNKVKHHRHTEFTRANFKSVIYSISGLLIVNLIVLETNNLLRNTFERPVFLSRENTPGAMMLEQSYQVKKK
jgi:hypothetical protein